MNGTVVIETERLYLREMYADDFDTLYKVLADPDIMKHISGAICTGIGCHTRRGR